MKIRCACGELIVDQTDFISYKARFIADQDWDDAVGDEDRLWSCSRHMWQCLACGRLYIDDHDGGLQCFVPESAEAPVNLLRSVHRDRWKRPMVGNWRTGADRGDLWWGFGVSDEGMEEFDRWDDLERRYFEVFKRLRGEDLLRSALLRRAGRTVHAWPQ